MRDPVTPQRSSQCLERQGTALSHYEKQVKALQSPAVRKKVREGVRRHRAGESTAERELHNARIAVAYRRSAARHLFNLNTYAGRRDAKKRIAIAEERLRTAEALLKERTLPLLPKHRQEM